MIKHTGILSAVNVKEIGNREEKFLFLPCKQLELMSIHGFQSENQFVLAVSKVKTLLMFRGVPATGFQNAGDQLLARA